MPKIINDLQNTILTKAKELFLKNGYQTLTIRNVAKECQVAVGTVYNYYQSKDMLVASVMLEDWLHALKGMEDGIREAQVPLDGLESVYHEIARFTTLYQTIWGEYSKTSGMPEIGQGRHVQLISQLSRLIEPLLSRFDCLFDEALPEVLAELLLSTAVNHPDGYERIKPVIGKLLQ